MKTAVRFFVLLGLLLTCSLHAQTFEKIWRDTVPGASYGLDVVAFDDVNTGENYAFLAAIPAPTSGNDLDLAVFVTDASGGMLWSKRYHFAGYEVYGQRGRILQTADKGFIIYTPLYSPLSSKDLLLMKLDSAGNVSWSRRYDYYDDDIADMLITSDGGYMLCGESNAMLFGGTKQLMLIKTDASGVPQWRFAYQDTLENNKSSYVDIDTCAGGYIVSGTVNLSSGSTSPLLARIDTTGAVVWFKGYAHPGFIALHKPLVVTTPAGFAVATNVDFTTSLFATDTAGTFLWGQNYRVSTASNHFGTPLDFIRTSDGGFAIAGRGTAPGPASGARPFLLKTDSLGTMQWSRRYLSSANTSRAAGVRQCPSGGYVLSGEATSPGSSIYAMRADNAGKTYCNEINYHTVVASDSFSTENIYPVRYTGILHEPITVTVVLLPLTDSIFCSLPLSVEQQTTDSTPVVFPNPSTGTFTLQGDFSRDATAFIYNAQGQAVEQFQPITNTQFDLSSQAAGLYLLVVMDRNKQYAVQLVKE